MTCVVCTGSETHRKNALHGEGKRHLNKVDPMFFPVSDMLQDNIRIVDIIPSVQSDHSAIMLKLCPTSECVRERAYWKFNSSFTQDKHFKESLKTEIRAFAGESSYLADPIMRWEYMKYKYREFSRNFSIKMSKEKNQRQDV